MSTDYREQGPNPLAEGQGTHMAARARTTSETRTPLNKQRLVTGAIAVADAEGIDALTMRKLAKELGVKPMAIYHHVANKDEVIDAMMDVVFGEIDLPAEGSEWKPAIRHRAHSARAVLLDHRWAVSVMETRTSPQTATLTHHDAVIGCFRRAGFSIEMTAHAYSLIDSYVYGFVLTEVNLPFESTEETHDVTETIMEQFPAAEFPFLTELAVDHVLRPGYNYSDEFAFGLDLILDGIEQSEGRPST